MDQIAMRMNFRDIGIYDAGRKFSYRAIFVVMVMAVRIPQQAVIVTISSSPNGEG